jgi:hypothetical protein
MDQLHEYAPNATLILNLRPAEDWVKSVTNWYGLGGRFLKLFQIDLGKVKNRHGALVDIYNNHSQFIRDFARAHPSHKLIEVDITSDGAGKVLTDSFGLDKKCWGIHNKNTMLDT